MKGLSSRVKQFEKQEGAEFDQAMELYELFLIRYPFREHPEKIDRLTPDEIYSPKGKDNFFKWVKNRLKHLGRLSTFSDRPFRNAAAQSRVFKDLLQITLSPLVSIEDKIDERWESIPGFGGDKHIAKKIGSLYYPDDVVPIFSTGHRMYFIRALRLDPNIDERCEGLSVGQKFIYTNRLLMTFKQNTKEFEGWNNFRFMRFLYHAFASGGVPDQST